MENLCILYVEWDSIVSLLHILLINVSVRFTGVENHNYFLSFFIPKSEAPGRDCAVIVGPMLFIESWNNLVIQPQFQYVTLFEQQIIGNISTPQHLTTNKASSKILIFAQVRTDLPNSSWISCRHERFSDKL